MDVVVIGGGYTGLTAARRVARAGARALVLDKGAVGEGASSRNGGQVLTGLKRGPGELLRRFGRERARALFAASLQAIDFLESLVAEEGIACAYARCGHLAAAAKPSHFDAFRLEQELLEREFGHPVRLVPRADQRSELGSDLYHGLLLDERSASLHPARYLRGLAQAAVRAGAELRPHTPVVEVRKDGVFRVRTPAGTVKARDVVAATNGYTDGALPALRRRVVPVGSHIVATAALPPAQAGALLPRGRVAFDSWHYLHYFRLSPDCRLLFGGRAQWTPATARSGRAAARILRRDMARAFPELAGVEVEWAWSGNICLTPDLLPRIGRLGGIHYALGYAGHGIALATWLGDRVGRAVLGDSERTPFHDLPFRAIPFYEGRPWFLPLAAAWYKVQDWIH